MICFKAKPTNVVKNNICFSVSKQTGRNSPNFLASSDFHNFLNYNFLAFILKRNLKIFVKISPFNKFLFELSGNCTSISDIYFKLLL